MQSSTFIESANQTGYIEHVFSIDISQNYLGDHVKFGREADLCTAVSPRKSIHTR
jgi:hypothetical protein